MYRRTHAIVAIAIGSLALISIAIGDAIAATVLVVTLAIGGADLVVGRQLPRSARIVIFCVFVAAIGAVCGYEHETDGLCARHAILAAGTVGVAGIYAFARL
jgi:hypothetical protein